MLMVMLLWLVSRVDLPLDDDDDDYRDALQRGDKKILPTAYGLVVERAEAPWLGAGMVGMVVVVASIGAVGVSVGAGEGG